MNVKRARQNAVLKYSVLNIAIQAQKAVIKKWLVRHYRYQMVLLPWDDAQFALAFFQVGDVVKAGALMINEGDQIHWPNTNSPRYWLGRLVKESHLQEQQYPLFRGLMGYRFSREMCDRLAAEAYAELEKTGMEKQPPPVTVPNASAKPRFPIPDYNLALVAELLRYYADLTVNSGKREQCIREAKAIEKTIGVVK